MYSEKKVRHVSSVAINETDYYRDLDELWKYQNWQRSLAQRLSKDTCDHIRIIIITEPASITALPLLFKFYSIINRKLFEQHTVSVHWSFKRLS